MSSSSRSDELEQLAFSETLAGYDRWSTSYDREENPAIAMTAWQLDRAPLDCAGQDVLELGCGTGRNAQRVLDEGARSYTGVDGSTGMLAVARSRLRDPRAQWLIAELLAPWQPPRTFDLAIVLLVLEHLPRLDDLVGNLAAAVRPGGRIRIVDLHGDLLGAGWNARFGEGAERVRFTSTAHATPAIRAALAPHFDVEIDEFMADDELVAAIPIVAKHRGTRVLVDIRGTRRA